MKKKLIDICSQISSKHTLKKVSVDIGFQKAKGSFKMDVLYKTVKRQYKHLWIQLEQSNLAYRLIHQIPTEDVFDFVKSELRTEAFEKNINYETFEQFSARAKR